MAVTLSRLCQNTEKTYRMKLIAGEAGLSNLVRWVHTVEDKANTAFLNGNELVFTTGIAQKGSDWLMAFVQGLHKAGAAGLVVNTGGYITEIPTEVMLYCQAHAFPLFTVPWETRLIDITYDFCRRIVTSEENEMSAAAAFRNLIFSPKDEDAYKITLEKRGFHADAAYLIMQIQPNPKTAELDEDEMKNLKFQAHRAMGQKGKPNCLFFQEKRLVCIFQDAREEQLTAFFQLLSQICQSQHAPCSLYAGLSPAAKGFENVPDAYHKSESALQIGLLRKTPLTLYGGLGIYKLLISIRDHQVLKELYQECLSPLAEFDQKNMTDYMETLQCYLEHNSSVQEVAQITQVHRNTVNYKLKRIREILQMEFTHENKLKLMLAFYIRDLMPQGSLQK